MDNREIKLSESFFSIQGEGVTSGVPSYFIRLFDCNLCCGGMKGELLAAGKASWVCDTIPSWTQFKPITFDDFIEKIRREGEELGIPLLDWLVDGTAHFIWTGGEPMMAHSISTIEDFLEYWDAKYPDNKVFHEVETNGTIATTRHIQETIIGPDREPYDPEQDEYDRNNLYELFDQINCSPKLANSGMKKGARINKDAIDQIKTCKKKNHWWKFVINCENEEAAFQDLEEIERDYIEPFDLDKRRLIIMPGVDNLEDLPHVTRVLYEVAKKYGCRAVTRGHILAWDQTTGV